MWSADRSVGRVPVARLLRSGASVGLVVGGLTAGCGPGETAEPPLAAVASAVTTYTPEWRMRRVGTPWPTGRELRCASDSSRFLCYGGATAAATTTSSATPAPTYSLVGDTYTELAPATAAPPGREHHALAYDKSRARLVTVGGRRRYGVYLQDTWTFDGTTWTEARPAHAPPGRSMGVLTEDPGRARLVLFGGSTDSGDRRDLWEWDGSDWTERPVPAYPSAPKGGVTRAVAVPAKNAILHHTPSTGEVHWYHDGVFTPAPSSAKLPAGADGALGWNAVRGTIEAFLTIGGRVRAYEGRLGTGDDITWTELGPGVPLRGPNYATSVAWDDKEKVNLLFEGSTPFELGWRKIANKPPGMDFINSVGSGYAEELMGFTVDVGDPDDPVDKLVVSATGLPAGASFDPTTRSFRWTPTPAQKGKATIRFSVTDGALTVSRDATVTVLWNDYAMLPRGPIDQLTTGDRIADSFYNYHGDRRLLLGLLELPSSYQVCPTSPFPTSCTYAAIPWPYTDPLVSCRFTGKNPGKVIASCMIGLQGAGSSFDLTTTGPVSENGEFALGHLLTIPGEGPGVTLTRYVYTLNPVTRIIQMTDRTTLLRPLP